MDSGEHELSTFVYEYICVCEYVCVCVRYMHVDKGVLGRVWIRVCTIYVFNYVRVSECASLS